MTVDDYPSDDNATNIRSPAISRSDHIDGSLLRCLLRLLVAGAAAAAAAALVVTLAFATRPTHPLDLLSLL